MTCVVCQQPGTVTVKALNGLPLGVVACEDCREAVKRREVGIVKRESGELHITDARHCDMPSGPWAHQATQLDLLTGVSRAVGE